MTGNVDMKDCSCALEWRWNDSAHYIPLSKMGTHRIPANQFDPPFEYRSQLSSSLPARRTGRDLKPPGF